MILRKHLHLLLQFLLMIVICVYLQPILEICQEKLKMNFNIDHWIRANKLSIYCNKTSCIILNRPKYDSATFNTSITDIKFVKNGIKYLDIILDNKLSWKPHIAKLTTQVSKSCGILSKLRHYYTTQPVLKAVYSASIHPYINYAVLNWCRASKTTIQPYMWI